MKLKKKMKLKDIPKEDLWYIVDLLSVFCGKEMGINRRRKKELVYVLGKKEVDGVHGFYDDEDNEIHFMRKRIKTLDQFIKTFIHEYTHYLQPCKTHYARLLELHGYENHPYEVEAFSNENVYFKKAYREIKYCFSLRENP
jgi:hypothetical protein